MSQTQRKEIAVNGGALECLIQANRPAAQEQINELRKTDFNQHIIQFYELLENGQKQKMAFIETSQELEEWIKAHAEPPASVGEQPINPSPEMVARLQKNAGINRK
jgi:hypothetical protein